MPVTARAWPAKARNQELNLRFSHGMTWQGEGEVPALDYHLLSPRIYKQAAGPTLNVELDLK